MQDAQAHLQLAGDRMGGDWGNPGYFRFGASSLLQDALKKLDISKASSSTDSNY